MLTIGVTKRHQVAKRIAGSAYAITPSISASKLTEDFAPGDIQSAGIDVVDGVVAGVAVDVDAASVADRIAVEPPALIGDVVALSAQVDVLAQEPLEPMRRRQSWQVARPSLHGGPRSMWLCRFSATSYGEHPLDQIHYGMRISQSM
jgi:hypothetical protein